MFNQFNYPLYYAYLVQKVGNDVQCQTSRIPNIDFMINKPVCLDFSTFNTTTFNSFNHTFKTGKKSFTGNYGNYDDHGYEAFIPVFDPKSYYDMMENLDNLQWISNNCVYLQFKLNYFNVNMNSVITVSVTYEKLGVKFYPIFKVRTLNRDKVADPLQIAALAFAILTMLTSFYMQLRTIKSKEEIKPILDKEYEHYITSNVSNRRESEQAISFFFKKIFYKFIYFIRLNFIVPDFLAFISRFKINILKYFI